jgi:NAD(P)-dependent dehydrogenase (short-subunit alcohol dehydrogenase family)
MKDALTGKTWIVTGATSGIGLACAEILAEQGGYVIGVGRSAERCRESEARLRSINPQGEARYLVGDLSLQSEVRALAERIRETLAERGQALDGLINNAGTFTYWLALTREGFETQWAVNHLSPFLLTHELLPLLQAAPAARVVTVSSESHHGARMDWDDPQMRRRYNGLSAYGRTKLANILFTLELNRRLEPTPWVMAFAADPGLVKTDIGFKGTPLMVRWIWERRRAGGMHPEESARGIVCLLTEPALQESGEMYWRHGQPRQASPAARDAQSAARLWALSEKMCGIPEEVSHAG